MAYSTLISIENLFQAWCEFKTGKRRRFDVQVFERNLEDNLFNLHNELKAKSYRHGAYREFYVNDPKRRHIHKAEVNDRIVHHLLYKYLYSLFDKTFIYDSYSCRLNKGTHRAVRRLEKYARIVSRNYTQDCWVLKLDIKQFFASVDHEILTRIITKKVKDVNILWLIDETLGSFCTDNSRCAGIPLGNLTSQVFANIYLNELDQFIKHHLKIKHYIRYADDFVTIDSDKNNLLLLIDTLKCFLDKNRKLELHPNKITLRKLSWGIDFCGYIVLPFYNVVRTKTKYRIFRKILSEKVNSQGLQSYLGYFAHANSYRKVQSLKNQFYLNQSKNVYPNNIV